MNMRILNLLLPISALLLTSCSSFSGYFHNLTSDDREDLIVYKTDKPYDDTQFDLIVPPDLITPNSTNMLEIPDYVGERGMDVFTVDTQLDNIKIIRSGRDSFISLNNIDKKIIWKRIYVGRRYRI